MWQLNGKLKASTGAPVNKAEFFIPIGGDQYDLVGSKYYSDTEQTVKFKGKPYPVSPKYSCEQRGNTRICKIIADPTTQAKALKYSGGWVHGMSAEEIDNNSFNGHVKTALRNASTGNLQIVMILLGLGVGVGIGWIVSSIVTPMLNPPNPQQIQQTVRPIVEAFRYAFAQL